MKDIVDNTPYMNLVTSEYAESEKFNAMLWAFLDKFVQTTELLSDMAGGAMFNLEYASGDQLDKLGSLVNLTRELPISNPDIPSILDDDMFRKVIKAKILSNHWDGTNEGLRNILTQMFPGVAFEILDNQDMSMSVLIIDPEANPTDIALMLNGFILPKPVGVNISYQVQTSALFGFDLDTSFVKGWDKGIWNNT